MRKRFWIYLLILLALIIGAATLHLSGQNTVSGTLNVTAAGQTYTLEATDLEQTQVVGSRYNGKGEEIEIDTQGISLETVIKSADITEYSQITVTASDSYSATVMADEVKDRAYLIEEEDGLRLVVFGDTDSKRSVTDVVEIVIE